MIRVCQALTIFHHRIKAHTQKKFLQTNGFKKLIKSWITLTKGTADANFGKRVKLFSIMNYFYLTLSNALSWVWFADKHKNLHFMLSSASHTHARKHTHTQGHTPQVKWPQVL